MLRPGDEFSDIYRAMGEEELLELARAYDSLVEPAQNALRAEFSNRRMDPPLVDEEAGQVLLDRLFGRW